MCRPSLLPLLLHITCVIFTLTSLPSLNAQQQQQQPNQHIHRHIPIIPDDLIPTHTTAYTTTTTPTPTSTTPPTPTRHTQHSTLAYITPWNRDGYTIATHPNTTHKFTHLSPVWFQIKATTHASKTHDGRTTHAILITGEHDVDSDWITQVRAIHTEGEGVRIVPRFIVEMTATQIITLLKHDKLQRQLIKRVMAIVDKYGLDGIVLEASDIHAIARQADSTTTHTTTTTKHSNSKTNQNQVERANTLIRSIGQSLHSHQQTPLTFVYVVRPHFTNSPYFSARDWRSVREDVDFVSLMTYDYSSGAESPGPNAPLAWTRQSLYALVGSKPTVADKAKILLGVNMYGMRWKAGARSGEAILGRDYVAAVAGAASEGKVVTRKWEEEGIAEERTEVVGEVVMYYPTGKSVQRRVELANTEGCGLSLWEIGQGLDELYEQL